MSSELHVVLGASGASGRAVVQELKRRNLPFRAIGRSAHFSDFEMTAADVFNPDELLRAVQGASHVYLCIGLPYSTKIWQQQWPLLMQNTIEVCETVRARLIFLDNIYMYGPAPLAVPFDETHAQHPTSRKGIVRKQTADMLLQAIEDKRVDALIGRSADFYGAQAVNSGLYVSFLDRMLKGKSPLSIAPKGVPHTFANTSDNGRALVALAFEESAYGQVWHLPVGEPITPEEATEIFNRVLGTQFKSGFMPDILLGFLSLFIKVLKEVAEMQYQNKTPYSMSFEKFRRQFPDFETTPYETGFREMAASFQTGQSV
ncbi:MAG TPA: NAD-dependent epimerase/dehydratase family protein [Saprospiraceae bacterium]|nr:NAD-dependent epimerase/dehydratase family protein [Saprospiraceae bacterium]